MKIENKIDGFKISIIVPVYNGEKYLEKLFNSLKNQTYKNFEVIFVNDFSNDNSIVLLQKLIKNDNRFLIVHRDSKGGTAVKGIEYGLNYCTGDYFFYLSQDDWLDIDYFEKAYDTYCKTKADILFGNVVMHYKNKDINNFLFPINNNYDSIENGRTIFYYQLSWKMHNNSLRSMELVRRIGIKAEYYNSCEYYGRLQTFYASKIAFFNSNFYYNQTNTNSIIKGKDKYFHSDVIVTDAMLHKVLVDNGYSMDKIKNNRIRIFRKCLVWIKRLLLSIFDGRFNVEERKYILSNIVFAIKLVF